VRAVEAGRNDQSSEQSFQNREETAQRAEAELARHRDDERKELERKEATLAAERDAELNELGVMFEPRRSSVASQPDAERDAELRDLGVFFEPRRSSVASNTSPQQQAALVAAEIEAQMQKGLAGDRLNQGAQQAVAPEKAADSTRETDGGISDSDGDRGDHRGRGIFGGGDMTSEAESSSGREWLRARATPQEESVEEGLTEAESSSGTSMMWDRADAPALHNLRRVSQRLQSFSVQQQQQQERQHAARGEKDIHAMSSRDGSVSPITHSATPTSGEETLWSARDSIPTLKRISQTLVSLGAPAGFGGQGLDAAGNNPSRRDPGLSDEMPMSMQRLNLPHSDGGEFSTQTTPRSGAEASAETTPRSGHESESTVSGKGPGLPKPSKPKQKPKPKAKNQPGHASQRRVMVGVGGMNMVV